MTDLDRAVWRVARTAEVLAGRDPEAELSTYPTAVRDRGRALLRPADRAGFVAARVLAAACAVELVREDGPVRTEAPVPWPQRCPHCERRDHGRPAPWRPAGGRGAEVHVSFSHSGPWVAAVAGWGPCGIDVQEPTDVPEDVLAPGERAWLRAQPADVDRARARLRLWVRKEAVAKARGTGLLDPAALDVRPDRPGPGGLLLAEFSADGASPGDGALGAVAVSPAGARR